MATTHTPSRSPHSLIMRVFSNEGKKAVLLQVGVFFCIVFPVVLVGLFPSSIVVVLLAVGVASLVAFMLSSLITMLNVYRQKEEIFLSNAGDALVVIDRSWNIELWNKTAEVLTGWNAGEVIGKPFRDIVKFVREGDQTENFGFIEEAMLYGRVGILEDHTVLVRKDGLQLPIGDSAAPLFDPGGSITGAIIVFRDKSREHDLEEAREAFMSLATRELHAPLATIQDGIKHMLGALTLTPGDIEAREYAEGIQKANERIYTLVNTMLNVLSVEQGKLAISPEPAHLTELVDTVLQAHAATAQARNLTVEHTYEEDIPSLNVDVLLTKAIVQNFLSNAINYTPEHGTISVRIKKEKGGVVLSISDTGYGIPEAQQSKVFSKLFRADNIKNRGLEGVGLGLYMIKLIIEEAGGRTWFESEEDKGTTFYLFLPSSGMRKKEGMKGLY